MALVYPLRLGKAAPLPHTARGYEGRLRRRFGSLACPTYYILRSKYCCASGLVLAVATRDVNAAMTFRTRVKL